MMHQQEDDTQSWCINMAKSNATVFTMSPPAPRAPPTAPRRPWFPPVAQEWPQGAAQV